MCQSQRICALLKSELLILLGFQHKGSHTFHSTAHLGWRSEPRSVPTWKRAQGRGQVLPKKWCQERDFKLRASEDTYIGFFMLGRQWDATWSTSCKQSSKPRVSLTADRCRPYYWLLLIEFLGFAELMQGQHGSPLKHDPRQKGLSFSPNASDLKHP